MKFFMFFSMTIAMVTFTSSCQKDNLEEAVLPQTAQGGQVTSGTNGQNGAQGEQGDSGADGQNGSDGQNGQDGADGAQGEQGATGAQGEPGTNGTDGTDGKDGEDGAQGEQGVQGIQGENGIDGTDGTNGINGEDGNANVMSFSYDLRAVTDTYHNVEIPEITSDVFDNDVILTYLKFRNLLYPIPSHVSIGFGGGRSFRADVDVSMRIGSCLISFREPGENYILRTPPRAGDLNSLRIVIIKSSSSETRKAGKQNVRQELKAAGVDIDNYDEVARYYGIK